MIKEKNKLKENVTLELRDKNGNLKLLKKASNLVLDDGHEIAASLLGGTESQTKLQCIALGDDNTAPVVGQTDLIGSELGRVTTSNNFVAPNKERFVGTFGPGVGTGVIEEAVLADTNAASGARKCFSRVLTGTITKGAGDTLTVTWEISNS